MCISHFSQLFQAPPLASLGEIIKIAVPFLHFGDEETTKELASSVTMGELEAMIK